MTVIESEGQALYPNYDQNELNKKSKYLLGYGGSILPQVITGAKGSYIYSGDKKILDFTSGQMSTLLGHGHPEITEVITQHAAHLDHLFSGMVSPPVLNLAERLCQLLPEGLDKAFFLSTGSESNEAAIKLAKHVTGKFEIVGLSMSWHGMTGVSSGVTYQDGRKNHGPGMPGNFVLPAPNGYRSIFRKADGTHDWETELDFGFGLIDSASCGSLAAVIIEPVLSSGGMVVLPEGYLKRMKSHCEKRGMLLIVDEAQTAIGRCGDMFGFASSGIVPDILCLSKTLGNGIPLSAVVTSNEIAKEAAESHYLFYTTHINDPLPCAVGNKVLEIVERDQLVPHAKEMGELFRKGLYELQSKYKQLGDIRGRGLMTGLEIVKPGTKESDPDVADLLSEKMMEYGLSANLMAVKACSGIFRIAPPITVSKEEVLEALSIIGKSFEEVLGN